VVLTGGPGGGKTTFMRELLNDPREQGRWIMVPEAAPLLFQAQLDARKRQFQFAVVRLQIALEDACASVAAADQVLLCHRGTLDPLAYWSRNGWEQDEFFASTMSRENHLVRYGGVVHLQTAAVGAEPQYRRWPEAHRPETPAQAAEIDGLCHSAWCTHPRFTTIASSHDWQDKARRARAALRRIVEDCARGDG
jgi:predicted ATPase